MQKTFAALSVVILVTMLLAPSVGAEECLASWYGQPFHGRTMANGRVYDMHDPTTTASNLYPLGTWLRVTSLNTGRSVVVQVRDRGLFKWAVDLSYAAFKEIDNPNRGVIPVRYEVVPGPDADAPPPASDGGSQTEANQAPEEAPTLARAQPSDRSTRTVDPQATEYVVQPGDTLRRIASDHGLSVDSLIELNSLSTPDRIVAGQVLRLKHPTVQQTAAPASHVVSAGDTLLGIARRYSIDAGEISRANALTNPDRLQVGQTLVIPGGESVVVASRAAPRLHVVSVGETLSGIARLYGVTITAMTNANGISDPSRVLIGQEIVIPGESGTAPAASNEKLEHVVGSGETLWIIAGKYGISGHALAEANGLQNPSLLRIGQTLTVPVVSGVGSPAGRQHVVRPGETLSGVAKLYGVNIRSLADLNGMGSDGLLLIDQVLDIP